MVIVDCPYPGCDFQTIDASDQLAATLLQVHASGAHLNTPPSSTTSTTTTNARVEKVRRPTISIGGSSEEWSYFQIRWKDYVTATKLTGRDLVIQLLECCDEDLRKDITRSAGGSLTNKSEEEVLAAIKILAVREENAMVARVSLHEMRQDRDEPIRSYGARVRGQAGVCKYTLTCTCNREISYSDHIIRDVIVRGLADPEIQLDLLSDSNQNMSLEEVFKFVEKKEAGRRSANRLLETQGVESSRSQYSKHKRQDNKEKQGEPCGFCGKRGHGKNTSANIRKKMCPAYNTTCTYCEKLHHFETVCRQKAKGPNKNTSLPTNSANSELGHFDTLCSAFTTENTDSTVFSITLDHHLYNHLTQRWQRQPSQPQPFINLTVSIAKKDYTQLGFRVKSNTANTRISAMADTGCQSCLTGINTVRRLGLSEQELIPVTTKMHAANNNNIKILGAIILRISGHSDTGRPLTTKQIVYVTDESDKFFLSREACIQLGIISNSFPSIGETSPFSTKQLTKSAAIIDPTDQTYEQCCNFKLDPINAPAEPQPKSALTNNCTCPQRQLPPEKPQKLPFSATEANRESIQEWLKNYYLSSTFNTCDHQPLPMMEGPPLRLMVNEDAAPVAHHTPVPVPIHWQTDVKAGLDQDVRLGVIEPVPVGEPVTWCHRMVICAKKNGQPRRTVDLQALNAHATRETHHTQSPFHQARAVPPNKKKTVFDCWNGYHSVPLHPDDRHLTTFITPWGRYRYKTAPQGYIASGDGYSRRFDEIVSEVPNKTKCIDDTLLWSDDLESSFFQAVDWLDLCGRNGITLNPEKFQFGQDTVSFAGFEITRDSVRPCKKFLDAIQNFPTPQNIHDIRSWFGLVNQVSYTFASSKSLNPFRHLLKPNTPFVWTNQLNNVFQESKLFIISEIESGITIFDKEKPTCLATDWSKSEIGFWLLQKHCCCISTKPFCCNTGWKTTLVGSRFTSKAESHYAPIEGEALAVADALDKARYFVLGCKELTVAVDHKPLLKVFGDRSLNDISNPRLRNLKEKSLRYKFGMMHVPGAKHKVPDALSRNPVGAEDPQTLHLPDDVDDEILTMAMSTAESLQAVTWNRVKLATNSDVDMVSLSRFIEDGFPPTKRDLPQPLQDFFQYKDDLYTVDGVILYKSRIVIPFSLRKDVLQILHSAHQSTGPMIARTMSSVFWPGITLDVNAYRGNCYDCNRNAPSQPHAPPYPVLTPEYPFQCICADFFHHEGSHYLVAVDRYSNWPIIEKAGDGSKGLIDSLRRMFATYGIADELASDGGPEFVATATRTFLKEWGVHHRLSSVAFPHSNCRAEIGVKTAKRLIKSNTGPHGSLDTNALQRAILQYRNTPDPLTHLSPSICLFGRPIKDFIPIMPGRYAPHPTWSDTLIKREEALRNRHMKSAEQWTEHTRRLPPLVVGDHVRIQNQTGQFPTKWDKTGRITEVKQFDQYVVKTDGSGRSTLRNRKFLRKFMPVKQPADRRSILEDLKFLPHHDNTRQAPQPVIDTPKNNSPTIPTTFPEPRAMPQSPDENTTPAPPLPNPGRDNAPRKPPLALRRLMDYNSKGLLE